LKGKPTPVQISKSKSIKEKIEAATKKLSTLEPEYNELLFLVPNIPTADSPIGKDESENIELKKVGKVRVPEFKIKDQVELGKDHNLMDNERAVKIGGT